MKRRPFLWISAVVAALAVVAAIVHRPPPPSEIRAGLTVRQALGEGGDGFARAERPRPFVFPADHGPHPAFRTEWWYFTGNLPTTDGRRFGFHFTIFRSSLAPQPTPRDSAWGSDQLYMAHFAVTDARGRRLHAFERFSRGALGLAGARAAPFRVWLEDWEVAATAGAAFPWRLRAAADAVAIDLSLRSDRPIVRHGDRGLSRKSATGRNASYYYSYTRMAAAGTVRIGGEAFTVGGTAWLDREWSTSVLEPDQIGWDWFGLHLDDGRDLMVFRLRRRDGAQSYGQGTIIDRDGRARALATSAFRAEPLSTWTSPRSGATYPVRWRLRVPAESIDVEVRPALDDQELAVSFNYWEGAVDVLAAGRPFGRGYLEMTGYQDAPRGR
ncbi:MAG: carotenoid 1,2-hydratase [Armatimonadetes bacterium]|nr:carotenoid 1,2-hydratase [Armatimonadota bacterium]